MAGVRDKQLISLGPWPAGIDNLNAETDLTRSDDGKAIIALREATNVDLDRRGSPHRRRGYARVVSGTDCHSFWKAPEFPFALFVDAGTQYGWQPGSSAFQVHAGVGPHRVASCFAGDRAYCTNNVSTWCVTAHGDEMPWGVETPPTPTAIAASNGGLDAGEYQVAYTWLTVLGEESGAKIAATVSVPDKGGIDLAAIPQPTSELVRAIRVYRSRANGGNGADGSGTDGTTNVALFSAVDIPVGVLSYRLGASALGRPLRTQFLDPMPPGHIVRHLGGRLHVASGNRIFSSEPLYYGLRHSRKDRRVGSRITLMECVGDGGDAPGMFVSDEKRTYWIGGVDPDKSTIRICYPYAAVFGTGTIVPGSMFNVETTLPCAYWLAANGVACLGLPGGVVVPLREKQAIAPLAEEGASLFRERDGIRQVLTSLQGASAKRGLSISDAASARVYKNGVDA